MFSGFFKVCHHDGERLRGAVLPPAQSLHDFFTGGVAGQQKASQPLYRHDFASLEYRGGLVYNVVAFDFLACGIDEFQLRPADRAGVGLGVKTPVQRVIVFPLALRAHFERSHRRVGAVIGYVGDYREPRSAVGTVSERVAVTPVVRIEYFLQAVGAGGDVRRDELVFAFFGHALQYLEFLVSGRMAWRDGDSFYSRQRRRFLSQPC